MDSEEESPLKRLLSEYQAALGDFDDLTLARWMCQTLGQLDGKAWRMSHPLVGTYRLCAELAHARQIWHKRLVSPPGGYVQAPCCRAPSLPLLTRDVTEAGLICSHCSATLIPFEEIPEPAKSRIDRWAENYAQVHAVAHWDQDRQSQPEYRSDFEAAARKAESLLKEAGVRVAPMLLEYHPAVIWEDHDECLEVNPEDIRLS